MPDPADPKVHAHPFKDLPEQECIYELSAFEYAELTVTSNFTFLGAASHPDELVAQAAALGYRAVAITDTNSLAGIVRAHVAAKDIGIPLVIGCRLRFVDPNGLCLFVYPTNRAAYGRLCRLLTCGKRRAPKGECHLRLDDLTGNTNDLLAVAWFDSPTDTNVPALVERLQNQIDDDRLSLALARLFTSNDNEYRDAVIQLSRQSRVPLVAVNDVHYHIPERRALHDVLTCIRHGCTLDQAGLRLLSNADRYLKSPQEMHRLFAEYPAAVARSVKIARRASSFSLDQLRYEYPREVCPSGMEPIEHLRDLTRVGAQERYPGGVPEKVEKLLAHEFALIEELNYASYFLTVNSIVRFARSREILCQGRGAAANSAVCYCLGVTSVDPERSEMLFERFVSRERNEPPDIDIDFEHERREEVIQHIYSTYGRERAGLTAEVISYRSRSAVRDVGKVFGLSLDVVDRVAKHVNDWIGERISPERLAGLGLDPRDRTIRLFMRLVQLISGFPRHLSQHVGGFVISQGPLCELVPIENAAMADRTVIEWDKDDIEALGMMKVDVLALGMLTCIRKALRLISQHGNKSYSLASIPAEDATVYDMICKADTIGVFQIESRAQMTMLPRLKPRNFYDLVIEVAIVRPGPIVGDMVHPFLRRRDGTEPVIYPDEKIKKVLSRTLGVPLFQEQAMALAIEAAGFTPGEAEMLRRTISAWKSRGKDSIPRYRDKFIRGMLKNNYTLKFAEQCFERLKGFSEYGFPESHSSSFALLVYASAWIKCYHPAAFAAALINSQPMGFYAPAQIIRDAREHGVEILPIDVNVSRWDCTLEGKTHSLRLGMRLVRSLRETDALAIAEAVQRHGPFGSVVDLWRNSEVSATSLYALALADGFGSMGLDRQQALWAVQSLKGKPLPLFDGIHRGSEQQDRTEALPPASDLSEVLRDYGTIGLSTKAHPLSFARAYLRKHRILTATQIRDERCCPHGCWATVAGLVLFRQRPGTAKGTMFVTLEDETGRSDLIVRPHVYQRDSAAAIHGSVLIARGRVERNGLVVHILTHKITELPKDVLELTPMSRDFR